MFFAIMIGKELGGYNTTITDHPILASTHR